MKIAFYLITQHAWKRPKRFIIMKVSEIRRAEAQLLSLISLRSAGSHPRSDRPEKFSPMTEIKQRRGSGVIRECVRNTSNHGRAAEKWGSVHDQPRRLVRGTIYDTRTNLQQIQPGDDLSSPANRSCCRFSNRIMQFQRKSTVEILIISYRRKVQRHCSRSSL